MSQFCRDRNLLSIEPTIFLGSSPPSQQLISGDDGAMSGTTFTSAGSDFAAAGIEPGMVLSVHGETSAEGSAYEIVSVDSATTLTASVLRADDEGAPIAPPAGDGLTFHVRTFAPQIRNVSDSLAEKLRLISESAGISGADYVDSAQLTEVAAHGVLAAVFTARAADAGNDANWLKAEHYRKAFVGLQNRLRLAVDADGDGTTEQTRSLGNVTLRRV